MTGQLGHERYGLGWPALHTAACPEFPADDGKAGAWKGQAGGGAALCTAAGPAFYSRWQEGSASMPLFF